MDQILRLLCFAALIRKKKVERAEKRKRVGGGSGFVRRGEFRKLDDAEYDAELRKRRKRADEERHRRARKADADAGGGEGGGASHSENMLSKKTRTDGTNIKIDSTSLDGSISVNITNESGSADVSEVENVAKTKARLRAFGEPITLFGEDDRMRAERLRIFLKKDMVRRQEHSDLALPKSHRGRNIFLEDEGDGVELSEDKSTKLSPRSSSTSAGRSEAQTSGETKVMSKERMCTKFFKRMLKEWAAALAGRPDEVKRSVRGKIATKTQKQCKDYMRPFFKMCKRKKIAAEIIEKVAEMVRLCEEREYVKAHSVYMDLAIGRAPWPIGATSVGIHERAARERIQTNKIAHVMNDEAARKYVTSMKRLMTFCQTSYPSDPSKMVLS